MALKRIALRDFVIVEQLELDLASGFTVLTGETGAGKSILIDAVQLTLGARADATVVRDGAVVPGNATLDAAGREARIDGHVIGLRRNYDVLPAGAKIACHDATSKPFRPNKLSPNVVLATTVTVPLDVVLTPVYVNGSESASETVTWNVVLLLYECPKIPLSTSRVLEVLDDTDGARLYASRLTFTVTSRLPP